MDIEALIKRECDNDPDNVHDRAYEKALRKAYDAYKNLKSLGTIQSCLQMARQAYARENSHSAVAQCMVLVEMEKELENA